MRRPSRRSSGPDHPNLRRSEEDRRVLHWTAGLGTPAEVYGERVQHRGSTAWRFWDPTRSKLGAALAKGYAGRLPREGERWLYLGAAAGTTASHLADLVGAGGIVFAVEKSPRPFGRLLALAKRYPNLLPLLSDARDPSSYTGEVPPVDGLYLDIAQPDQVRIAVENGGRYLRSNGVALLALKTSSMGRERSPRDHLDDARAELAGVAEVTEAIPLDPIHRRHFFLEIRPRPRWFDGDRRPPTPRAAPPAGPRR
jgi:fibrillarin-like pre-rRNA processing protein